MGRSFASRYALSRLSLGFVVGVPACATPTPEAAPSEAPATPVVAAPTADPAPAPAPAPEEDDIPVDDDLLEEDSASLDRVEFAPKVTLYTGPQGQDTLASRSKRTRNSDPWVLDAGSDGARAHVACDSGEYEVEVHVAQADLQSVVTDFALATPTATQAADASSQTQVGVSLAPGAVVEVLRTKGELAEVEFQVEVVHGRGWIPKAVVAKSFRPAESDPRSLPDEDRISVHWQTEVPVRATPGGRSFAKVRGPVTIQPLGEKRDEHFLAAISFVFENRSYAIGWIPESALSPEQAGRPIPGGVIAGQSPSDGRRITVPEGATLLSKSGVPIGVVTREAELICLSSCESKNPLVQLSCVTEFPARVADTHAR